MKQTTNTLLMIRPASFRLNEQTAVNNFYQRLDDNVNAHEAANLAREEFDELVKVLRRENANVLVMEDTLDPETPDALFPNNWVSFHSNSSIILYPMFAENRRLERRDDLSEFCSLKGLSVLEVIDVSASEKDGLFLEGTGSMVLDRENKVAFCAISPRADETLFRAWCDRFGYEAVVFHAFQTIENKRSLIYHTNVMMCLGESFSTICLECIDDIEERRMVEEKLKSLGKEVIAISEKQVACFAGNMLQISSLEGNSIIVMSSSAYDSLNAAQRERLFGYGKLVHSPLTVIETLGGGSARCMIAEVFLPKIEQIYPS